MVLGVVRQMHGVQRQRGQVGEVGDGFDVAGQAVFLTWKHLCTLQRDFDGMIYRKINEIRNSDGFGRA